jgi:hypothetical protein
MSGITGNIYTMTVLTNSESYTAGSTMPSLIAQIAGRHIQLVCQVLYDGKAFI